MIVAGLYRPPYGSPTGPLLDEAGLVDAYLDGNRTGHSPDLHIEDDTLLIDRLQPIALRLGNAALLIRTDAPTGRVQARATVRGLRLIEDDPPLATVVALQVLGLPAASWALWGDDADESRSRLTGAAYHEEAGP